MPFPAQDIVAGDAHTCSLDVTLLTCWGANDRGQLGLSDTTDRATPNEIPPGANAVTAGAEHTCAVMEGQLFCWGANGRGQTGTGLSGDVLDPQDVNL